VFNALKPIKLAIEALGRRDANLLTADAILKFMVKCLQQNNDSNSLLFRLKERRNKE
jgi:hypothetical protein